ncbi:MAG TPA: hypothetical protein PLW34_02460 [Termitinemataceae bacterium]|nr:hypothetical protein [Termitinemataceae bacterium]HOM23616.1 hypothetical protein [Termitinemataceae bacterium]HPP99716.1 hypothetical protein [Termitinemataceae bacterium]
MFYIRWAIKNLYRGKKWSLGFLCFLSLVVTGLFFLRGIFRGTETSLQNSLRNYYGDVVIRSVLSQGLPFSGRTLQQQAFAASLEGVVEELVVQNVVASGKMGFGNISVVGTSGGYFDFVKDSIEWIGPHTKGPEKQKAVLVDSLALKVGVTVGDELLLEFRTKDGLINTVRFVVGGIFRGNKYIVGDCVYVTKEDAQNLVMDPMLTSLYLYLKDPQPSTFAALQAWLAPFDNAISVGMISNNPRDVSMFAAIFDFYHKFFALFVWMFSFVFFFILYLGVQNTVFLRFHERKEEILSLMAFGMEGRHFLLVALWEMFFFLLGAFVIGYGCSVLLAKLVALIRVMSISSEMVVVVGGPTLRFNLYPKEIVLFILFIGITLGGGTLMSVFRYFSREVGGTARGLY